MTLLPMRILTYDHQESPLVSPVLLSGFENDLVMISLPWPL